MKFKDIVLKNFTKEMAKPEHAMFYYNKIYDGYKLGLIKSGCIIGLAEFEVRQTKTQFIKGFRKCKK